MWLLNKSLNFCRLHFFETKIFSSLTKANYPLLTPLIIIASDYLFRVIFINKLKIIDRTFGPRFHIKVCTFAYRLEKQNYDFQALFLKGNN